MKDSTGFTFNDLRVIGGNPSNANQDGMDWLGGGDAIVRDAFLRTSDDVFAMEGNWDGYTDEQITRPGHDVQNILIEHSELSTSISNIVRAGWPRKSYNSRNFTLRDSDILHGGIGACGQTFGLLGFWGANGAKGDHSNFTFENLFLDNWYSLVQMELDQNPGQPGLHGFTFRNIWALDQPPLANSSMTGDVSDVTFDNVKVFAPRQKVSFTAQPSPGAHYTWLFGDGTQASGRRVRHSFPDAEGTQLDGTSGAGRFRVLLHVEGQQGDGDSARQDWAGQGVVAVASWHDAVNAASPTLPGLTWQIYPGDWTQLPDFRAEHAVFNGESPNLHADSQGFTRYAAAWDGLIDIPADGGYTFHLIDRDGARVVIEVAKTGPPFAQVCGSPGNAMRYDLGSLGLRAGKHTLHMEGLHSVSQGSPRLLWEGPALPLSDVPPSAYSHLRHDLVTN